LHNPTAYFCGILGIVVLDHCTTLELTSAAGI